MSKSSDAMNACPIEFDHHSASHAEKWPDIYREMRSECPRARSSAYGGFWVATRYRDIVAVSQKLDSISAHQGPDSETGEMWPGTAIPGIPGTRSVPNETDSPEWDRVRGFLNKWFSPRAVEQRRERAQQFATQIVDQVIEHGTCDIVDDLASPLPAMVTTDIFGFPVEEWRLYSEPIHTLVSTRPEDPAFAKAAEELLVFRRRVDEEVAARRVTPSEDFLNHLAHGTIDGEPLGYQLLQDVAWQILSGGVDTTATLIANVLLYLGRNPDDRQLLIQKPELLPKACEEFIRFFSPLQGAGRNVKRDAVINGWPLKERERILLAYASGNRDADIFERSEEVVLDRSPNPHLGFGAGQHRCLGAFLARMMFQTMVSEILKRIPDYQVVEDRISRYPSIGYVNGLIHAPITFEPGRKAGD